MEAISAKGEAAIRHMKLHMTVDTVHDILLEEIVQVFKQVLIDAGVYKCTDEGRKAFGRFIDFVNN